MALISGPQCGSCYHFTHTGLLVLIGLPDGHSDVCWDAFASLGALFLFRVCGAPLSDGASTAVCIMMLVVRSNSCFAAFAVLL